MSSHAEGLSKTAHLPRGANSCPTTRHLPCNTTPFTYLGLHSGLGTRLGLGLDTRLGGHSRLVGGNAGSGGGGGRLGACSRGSSNLCGVGEAWLCGSRESPRCAAVWGSRFRMPSVFRLCMCVKAMYMGQGWRCGSGQNHLKCRGKPVYRTEPGCMTCNTTSFAYLGLHSGLGRGGGGRLGGGGLSGSAGSGLGGVTVREGPARQRGSEAAERWEVASGHSRKLY